MDRKTTGILATVAAVLLCGCPGIFVCLFGALSAAGIGTWSTQLNSLDSSGSVPTWLGVAFLCLGLLLIAVPMVVAFLVLPKKPEALAEEVPPPA